MTAAAPASYDGQPIGHDKTYRRRLFPSVQYRRTRRLPPQTLNFAFFTR